MRRIGKRQIMAALLVALLALGCVGCGPEDGRARGGGSGADGGNKAPAVVPESKMFVGQSS